MEEKVTKPTIETVLERMVAMEGRLTDRMDGLTERMGGLTERMDGLTGHVNALEERLNTRLDRIESLGNITRSEMLDLRIDFRDVRSQLKEHLPALR